MSAPVAEPAAEFRITSPRTLDMPMAFTPWEFIRGCLLTYAFFLLFSAFAWAWTIYGVILAPVYAAPYGFASLVICGAPMALITGLLLRRETRTWVHLWSHGLVGFLAGGFGILVALCILDGDLWRIGPPHLPDFSLLQDAWIIAFFEMLLTVFAAMAGWRVTSRRALQSDPWWVDPKVRDWRNEDEKAEDAAVENR